MDEPPWSVSAIVVNAVEVLVSVHDIPFVACVPLQFAVTMIRSPASTAGRAAVYADAVVPLPVIAEPLTRVIATGHRLSALQQLDVALDLPQCHPDRFRPRLDLLRLGSPLEVTFTRKRLRQILVPPKPEVDRGLIHRVLDNPGLEMLDP